MLSGSVDWCIPVTMATFPGQLARACLDFMEACRHDGKSVTVLLLYSIVSVN